MDTRLIVSLLFNWIRIEFEMHKNFVIFLLFKENLNLKVVRYFVKLIIIVYKYLYNSLIFFVLEFGLYNLLCKFFRQSLQFFIVSQLLQFGSKNRKHRVHYVEGIHRLNTKMEHRDTLRVLADIVQYSSRALGYLDRNWNLFRCHVYQIKDSGGLRLLSSFFLLFFLLLLLKSLKGARFDKLANRSQKRVTRSYVQM